MFIYCVVLILTSAVFTDGFELILMHDGPVLIGGTIHFEAEVKDAYFSKFRYEWSDNAKPKPHSKRIYEASRCQWNVTYPKGDYKPGEYLVELNVCEENIIDWPCNKKTITFEITADLNGQLEVLQNNTIKKKSYVSNHTEVEHRVVLKDSDLKLLNDNNFTVIAFWLINCTHLGMTRNLTFRYNYTTADEDVTVKAIVVAAKFNESTNVSDVFAETSWPNGTSKLLNATLNHEKLLNITNNKEKTLNTTLSKEKSINNSISDENLTNTTIDIIKTLNGTVENVKINNSTIDNKKILNATFIEKQFLAAAFEQGKILEIPFKKDSYFTPWPDGSCNGSFIPEDPDKFYGYFHHEVKPRRPIQILNVASNNWLKNGDLFNLTVTFTGSLPYHHCIQFIVGEHNTTGNETCQHTQKTTSDKINIVHYFGSGDKHTVLFIINNSVSKSVTSVIVTNYIAKKHAQLSVVIVPVTFIAIAIILIVFGVAYYFQSINRGPIEVADFDFSANNDTEYKSFKGRLLEALSTAFTRSNLDEEPEEGPTWSPSRNLPNKPHMFVNSSDSE